MNTSGQAPLFDEVAIALQAHLDRLNAAFADFKRAEAETSRAQEQKDTNKLIHLWYAKTYVAQAYMQEWDVLTSYGTLSYDEQRERFQLMPDETKNQSSEAE